LRERLAAGYVTETMKLNKWFERHKDLNYDNMMQEL